MSEKLPPKDEIEPQIDPTRRGSKSVFSISRRLPQKFYDRGEPFTLQGLIGYGSGTEFAINGEDFHVTHETWVIGKIRIGAPAKVTGIARPGVGRCAAKIVVS